MLKNAKKYLFKLNNNQRINYQFKMFKTTFTRIIINKIKKMFSITTITRVISTIEAVVVSTIKSKQKIIFKDFMCYICDKADHYRKDYTMQY